MTRVPLSVLDLVPVSSGSTTADAVRNAVDLARRTEEFGYRRYWFAEHHLNPGVLGSSPSVLIALAAAATSRIRLGSAGFQLGHRTALSVVEEVGLVDALHPGRIDLGLGRSSGRPPSTQATPAPARPSNGLVVPKPFSFARLLGSPRIALHQRLLQLPGAQPPDYGEQIDDLLALLHGTYQYEGVEGHASPGEGADVELWILGSSGGQSATVAGERGLRFAANYHVAPAGVLEAVAAYRAAFRPSEYLDAPYVSVSADVVVADDDATARELAAGYAPWVRSIRTAAGAIAFPTPAEAAAFPWTEEDRELVADRLETQFVGAPDTVARRLLELQEATDADELVVTTITHDHADRVRSYELLAKEWNSVAS
ncbi:LLM class flavin-dependent oxidoreductase [Cryptosporangium arvum]|uniref:Flavin-dependent oxidoreductase, F420-dependent methylene-tetrahydromethanopterin reductase n=1 Tax=Cryptosporangium arvum DSM 44712 TaxID=927661 RepID=A0A010YPW8_9ACTN|nr:LLM class flavin-dependent oxidoreductase [Cryptosporangium arvum]EXG82225.1 flavin-dependent oxidoreductase, F420-dependent methylene-tetrahydromethanopterin reductase [Cryptosporangium arvum DSM 44712]